MATLTMATTLQAIGDTENLAQTTLRKCEPTRTNPSVLLLHHTNFPTSTGNTSTAGAFKGLADCLRTLRNALGEVDTSISQHHHETELTTEGLDLHHRVAKCRAVLDQVQASLTTAQASASAGAAAGAAATVPQLRRAVEDATTFLLAAHRALTDDGGDATLASLDVGGPAAHHADADAPYLSSSHGSASDPSDAVDSTADSRSYSSECRSPDSDIYAVAAATATRVRRTSTDQSSSSSGTRVLSRAPDSPMIADWPLPPRSPPRARVSRTSFSSTAQRASIVRVSPPTSPTAQHARTNSGEARVAARIAARPVAISVAKPRTASSSTADSSAVPRPLLVVRAPAAQTPSSQDPSLAEDEQSDDDSSDDESDHSIAEIIDVKPILRTASVVRMPANNTTAANSNAQQRRHDSLNSPSSPTKPSLETSREAPEEEMTVGEIATPAVVTASATPVEVVRPAGGMQAQAVLIRRTGTNSSRRASQAPSVLAAEEQQLHQPPTSMEAPPPIPQRRGPVNRAVANRDSAPQPTTATRKMSQSESVASSETSSPASPHRPSPVTRPSTYSFYATAPTSPQPDAARHLRSVSTSAAVFHSQQHRAAPSSTTAVPSEAPSANHTPRPSVAQIDLAKVAASRPSEQMPVQPEGQVPSTTASLSDRSDSTPLAGTRSPSDYSQASTSAVHVGAPTSPTRDEKFAVLEDDHVPDEQRIQAIVAAWNQHDWAAAEKPLLAFHDRLLRRGAGEQARRVRHLLGVCASFQGKWSLAMRRFLSVLRAPVQDLELLDDGDCAAAWWLGDTYALLNRRKEAWLAYSLAAQAPQFRRPGSSEIWTALAADKEIVGAGVPRADFEAAWDQQRAYPHSYSRDSLLNVAIVPPRAALLALQSVQAHHDTRHYSNSKHNRADGLRVAATELRPAKSRAAAPSPAAAWCDRPQPAAIDASHLSGIGAWPLPFDPFFTVANAYRGRSLEREGDILEYHRRTLASAGPDAALTAAAAGGGGPGGGPAKLKSRRTLGLRDGFDFSAENLAWLVLAVRGVLRELEFSFVEEAGPDALAFRCGYCLVRRGFATIYYFSILVAPRPPRGPPGRKSPASWGIKFAPDGLSSARMVGNYANKNHERGVPTTERHHVCELVVERLEKAKKAAAAAESGAEDVSHLLAPAATRPRSLFSRMSSVSLDTISGRDVPFRSKEIRMTK